EVPASGKTAPVEGDLADARLAGLRDVVGDRISDRAGAPPRRAEAIAPDTLAEEHLAGILRAFDDERRSAEVGEPGAQRQKQCEYGSHNNDSTALDIGRELRA